jgi:hypothetical protein
MSKRRQKLDFLTDVHRCKLSISSSRFFVATRGLRKSSSLTNGIGPGRNKTALKEYGTEARGLDLSPFYNHLSMRPFWALR